MRWTRPPLLSDWVGGCGSLGVCRRCYSSVHLLLEAAPVSLGQRFAPWASTRLTGVLEVQLSENAYVVIQTPLIFLIAWISSPVIILARSLGRGVSGIANVCCPAEMKIATYGNHERVPPPPLLVISGPRWGVSEGDRGGRKDDRVVLRLGNWIVPSQIDGTCLGYRMCMWKHDRQ